MYEDILKTLRDEVSKSNYKIKETEENMKKCEKLRSSIKQYEEIVDICSIVLDSLKPLDNDLQKFINDKSTEGMMRVNQAIALASEVIPDCMKGAKFEFDKDKAWLSINGRLADSAEGSGYKGTTSAFIQSAILKQNPQILQTLILDEPLAKVSTENSATVSAVLPHICQDLQVILIEQKKEVYANFKHITYRFFKDENGTRVEREINEGA